MIRWLVLFLLISTSVHATDFVKTSGTQFVLGGKPFWVTGVNNHYLTSGTHAEVIRVLDDAVALGANVIRTFLQPVIGSLDDSVPTIWKREGIDSDSSDLNSNGNYLLYWNHGMAINEGPNGMQNVDFLIAEAKKRNLKLIIGFLDFWAYMGGIQQMRAWYGSSDKNSFFFRDLRAKYDYETWVSYVIHRVNILTHIAYLDEPTIMAWELANEANAEPFQLRYEWTTEMSAYVKSEDPNHLVASGNANNNLAALDITIPSIDFGTWHGYPRFLRFSVSQFDDFITSYCQSAVVYHKPVLLEEFGYARSNPDQVQAYAKWLHTLTKNPNCAGWLVWRLVSRQESGEFPVDEYDQFDIHNDGSRIWNTIKSAIQRR